MNLHRIVAIGLSLWCAVAAASGASAALAASTATAPAANSVTSMPRRACFGTLVYIDAATAVVNSKHGQDTLIIDASTVVRTVAHTDAIADLHTGIKVIAVFEVKNGKKVAIQIAEKPHHARMGGAAPANGK